MQQLHQIITLQANLFGLNVAFFINSQTFQNIYGYTKICICKSINKRLHRANTVSPQQTFGKTQVSLKTLSGCVPISCASKPYQHAGIHEVKVRKANSKSAHMVSALG